MKADVRDLGNHDAHWYTQVKTVKQLTHSTEQSPSWEAKSRSASQGIPPFPWDMGSLPEHTTGAFPEPDKYRPHAPTVFP
jgi:hypothetical protein